MGLFDKIFNSAPSKFTYTPKNEQEAWIAIMYSCMAIDGDVSDSEISTLTQMVIFKTMFKKHDVVAYYKSAAIAHKQIGSKALIDCCIEKVSDKKNTLFALITELLLSDGILADKEKEIIEYLSTAMNLDLSTAEKIVEVTLIKMDGNVVLA